MFKKWNVGLLKKNFLFLVFETGDSNSSKHSFGSWLSPYRYGLQLFERRRYWRGTTAMDSIWES